MSENDSNRAAAGEPPPTEPCHRYEVKTFADSLGRKFTHFVSLDGSPHLFKGVVAIERQWPDGAATRRQFPFAVPAVDVDEAFANFDAAQAETIEKANAELDAEHKKAVLSGEIPTRRNGPPPVLHLPDMRIIQ
jgi:hypothetical protein